MAMFAAHLEVRFLRCFGIRLTSAGLVFVERRPAGYARPAIDGSTTAT
jgi:hypothetical protein